tara:strand:- start:13297 stop:14226 length:930 start_codon:yes stop_codon:yes gene_type:complete
LGKRKDRNKTDRLGHYSPRFWLSWLAVGLTWALAKLPYRAQHTISRWLSRLAIATGSSRVKTIRRNIDLCFPELPTQAREELIAKNLYSTIFMFFDLLAMVWGSKTSVLNRGHVSGEQHLHDALAMNKPIILVSCHATSFLLAFAKLSAITPYSAVYRRMDNPVLEKQLYQRAASKYPIETIHRKEIPYMLKQLANQGVVLIVPDQDFGPKRSVFIQHFGIDTATITAIPQYAKSADACVLLVCSYREPNGHYVLQIDPVLDNYPSGDDLADTQLWSDWLEREIRKHPEDYFWLHKRFKTRPEDQQKLY